MIYYKYRSLENLRNFLDIVINGRLYMAQYYEFNDPSEGLFLTDITTKTVLANIRNKKQKLRICCLSKDKSHTLLWAHYADGHKGCCIGVEVSEVAEPVKYVKELPFVNRDTEPKELLKYKSTLWNYEDEVRIFKDDLHNPFLDVTVKEITFGYKVKDYSFYEDLIRKIDSSIVVKKMKHCEINDGYLR